MRAISAPPLESSRRSGCGSPLIGHRASPVRSGSVERLSDSLLATALAGGGRRPLARVDSPNSQRSCDSPSDEELSLHFGKQRALKRFRSFGSGNRLNQLADNGTSSPQHATTRQRAGASPAPPPIEICDTVQEPPRLASVPPPLVVPLTAWRPPPIVRPASVEPPTVNVSMPPSRPPALSLSLIREEQEVDESLAVATTPPTPRCGPCVRGASPTPHMSRVAPCLLVGDKEAASSLPALLAAGVTHILNCTKETSGARLRLARPLEGMARTQQYLQLNLLDDSSDLPRMHACLRTGVRFVKAAIDSGGTVLIHCHKGISRAPTLAIAYLVYATRKSADEIFEQMRAARPVIDPNFGYMLTLHEWERHVLATGSAAIGESRRPREEPSPPLADARDRHSRFSANVLAARTRGNSRLAPRDGARHDFLSRLAEAEKHDALPSPAALHAPAAVRPLSRVR